MLILLRRDLLEDAVVRVHGSELRLYDHGTQGRIVLTKSALHADAERARRAAEKIVARRLEAGWEIAERVESPWVDWLAELESLGARIAGSAADAGVSVEHKVTLRAQSSAAEVTVHPAYGDLVRSMSYFRHSFLFWQGPLRFKVSFELEAHPDRIEWAYRAWEPDETIERGALGAAGIFETQHARGGEARRFETAEDFRAGFLQHVRSLSDGAIQAVL